MSVIITQGECVDVMRGLPAASIDLTVTSPPYDDMRTYKGFEFDFTAVAEQLYRLTKPGGVVVWVVGDATVKGSETGTSFRQALHFKELGFNLETMIWEKTGSGCLGSNYFYGQNFEFNFVLTKGFPKSFNPIKDRENVVKSGSVKVNGAIGKDGKGSSRVVERKPFGKRSNIWRYDTAKNSDHPAPFPEALIVDHILSWSNPGDTVLDPFLGSGTTALAAQKTGRNFIGCDVSAEYVAMSKARIGNVLQTELI